MVDKSAPNVNSNLSSAEPGADSSSQTSNHSTEQTNATQFQNKLPSQITDNFRDRTITRRGSNESCSSNLTTATDYTANKVQPQPLPLLGTCIEAIKNLAQSCHSKEGPVTLVNQPSSPNATLDRANDLVCAIAFLCHLKKDQSALYALASLPTSQDKSSSFFTTYRVQIEDLRLADFPAISAVHQDINLFYALLTLLSSDYPQSNKPASTKHQGSPNSTPNAPRSSVLSTSKSGQSGVSISHPGNKRVIGSMPAINVAASSSNSGSNLRKRASALPSDDIEVDPSLMLPPEKIAKKTLGTAAFGMSPRPRIERGIKLNQSGKLEANGPAAEALFLPPVFAATVFFIAFRHSCHWPAPLMGAYAEDCFGSRRWVDDERCHLLVSNITTGLEDASDDNGGYDLHQAQKFWEKYSTINLAPKKGKLKATVINTGDSVKREVTSSLSTSAKSSAHDEFSTEQVLDTDVKVYSGEATNSTGFQSHSEPLSSSTTPLATLRQTQDNISNICSIQRKSSRELQPEGAFSSSAPAFLDLTPVRKRYFGVNLQGCQQLAIQALVERLQSKKVKQNSKLLGALPSFISIPKVRALSAQHLERWLQSAALSLLAKGVFTSCVKSLKNQDPPLPEDIQVIHYILNMKLKSHQQALHTEHICEIVRTIPTASVLRHIILHLLREDFQRIEISQSFELSNASKSIDSKRMLEAVCSSIQDQNFVFDGLATALLSMLFCPSEKLETVNDKRSYLSRVCLLYRRIPILLGGYHKYHGLLMIRSLIKGQRLLPAGHTSEGCHEFSRLLFEAVCLLCPIPNGTESLINCQRRWRRGEKVSQELDSKEKESICTSVSQARTLLLDWSLSVYLPTIQSNNLATKEISQKLSVEQSNKANDETETLNTGISKKRKRKDFGNDVVSEPVGAGGPDYSSILDGEKDFNDLLNDDPVVQEAFRNFFCMLFLSEPDSQQLKSFLAPYFIGANTETTFSLSLEQLYQIHIVRELGLRVTSEMLIAVVNMPLVGQPTTRSISVELAFTLFECLLLPCGASGNLERLIITDEEQGEQIIWKLYELSEFRPSLNRDDLFTDRIDSLPSEINSFTPEFRVARPGLWWRATALSLIICGASSSCTAKQMWKVHPTLRALMKMSLSGRYRFPTVDCSDSERDRMKQMEADCRDREAQVAIELFLPKTSSLQKKTKSTDTHEPFKSVYQAGTTRVSARQREKQERAKLRQQDQQDQDAKAESYRLRKAVKDAQRTIMLLDPRGPARKPPRDAVNLILSVNEMFDIPIQFRSSDFFCEMVDFNDRGSIERAYEWLLPIISKTPNIINDQLPPGASCLLLLRAYGQQITSRTSSTTSANKDSEGTTGAKGDALLDLSAPLLKHVRHCLEGTFGADKAQNAATLILSDLCDATSAERRRCARRVLQDAIGDKISPLEDVVFVSELIKTFSFHSTCGWLRNLINLQYAYLIVPLAVQHISKAVFQERASILRSYTVGLLLFDRYLKQRNESKAQVSFNFVSTLCELLSTRPHVCASAMHSDGDYRQMMAQEVYKEVERLRAASCQEQDRQQSSKYNDADNGNSSSSRLVSIRILKKALDCNDHAEDTERIEVEIPFAVLRASVLLLSAWHDSDIEKDIHPEVESSQPRNGIIVAMCQDLLGASNKGHGSEVGAAGAFFVSENSKLNKRLALTVEDWTMLAKSRSEYVGRHAAMSAPTVVLPRLLLCCGLPGLSLVAILQRLGSLSCDNEERTDMIYRQLLSPTYTSNWGLGHLKGTNRSTATVARRLLGRINAYLTILKKPQETQISDNSRSLMLRSLQDVENTPFVSWLKGQIINQESSSPTRSSNKQKITHTSKGLARVTQFGMLSSATTYVKASVLTVLRGSHRCDDISQSLDHEHDHPMECDRSRLLSFKRRKRNQMVKKVEHHNPLAMNLKCPKEENISNLDSWLKEIYEKDSLRHFFVGTRNKERKESDTDDLLMVAKDLLSAFFSQGLCGIDALICRHFASLTSNFRVAPDIWMLLFQDFYLGKITVSNSDKIDIQDALVSRCMDVWSGSQIYECQKWLLLHATSSVGDTGEMASENPPFRLPLVVKFLLSASLRKSYQDQEKAGILLNFPTATGALLQSVDECRYLTEIAIKCCLEETNCNLAWFERNGLPDWLSLLLIAAESDKKYCHTIILRLLELLDSTGVKDRGHVIECVILRLYCYFPFSVALGDVRVRTALLNAARANSPKWLTWRCPLDSQALELIKNLASSKLSALALQSYAEFAKQHPLIVARHFADLQDMLFEDGMVKERQIDQGDILKLPQMRSVITSEFGPIRFRTRHWGDGATFDEIKWMHVLDSLSFLPLEVTFHDCSLEMGLIDILSLVVRLLGVQTRPWIIQQEWGGLKNVERIRAKLQSLLPVFSKENFKAYSEWLESKLSGIESWGKVSEILSNALIDLPSGQTTADSQAQDKDTHTTVS